ncbi:uncharacterized protein PHALS_05676 [Plasmopara halstedii]|uniref:Uncharacterized protein n=1 Tax=Plasmopara halstedii TaxID=4781 RepID=A0A0P1B1V9_PLAHL|nr:uncharacterized protein PHALS_05676 [Plasmopara halstedii]CEG48206.1 hypothetical protein PHALS_05676 [Plasmopara halstedii]|eukprot:XP_024584575.1 hypothetical protein PHALS_05676 [Plasmopara halstedii]
MLTFHCYDRVAQLFIDVLGQRKVANCSCQGFLEMNVLSPTLLQKILSGRKRLELRKRRDGSQEDEVRGGTKDDKETSVDTTAKVVNAETESVTGGYNREEQIVRMPIVKQIVKQKLK